MLFSAPLNWGQLEVHDEMTTIVRMMAGNLKYRFIVLVIRLDSYLTILNPTWFNCIEYGVLNLINYVVFHIYNLLFLPEIQYKEKDI